jgi:chorismate dehydratase
VLREVFEVDPMLEPFESRAHVGDWPTSVLLIGDKVITDPPPPGMWQYELDLGEVWTETTGLPFVFALWMLHPSRSQDADSICAVLDRQQRANRMRFDVLVAQGARDHDWPVDLARRYLSQHLTYTFDNAHRAGLACFAQKCREHGLLPKEVQLRLHECGQSD